MDYEEHFVWIRIRRRVAGYIAKLLHYETDSHDEARKAEKAGNMLKAKRLRLQADDVNETAHEIEHALGEPSRHDPPEKM